MKPQQQYYTNINNYKKTPEVLLGCDLIVISLVLCIENSSRHLSCSLMQIKNEFKFAFHTSLSINFSVTV